MSPTQKENPKNTVVKIFASIAVFIGVAVFAFGVPEEGGCGREVGLDEAGLAQSSEGQAFMPHEPIGQIVCCKCTTGNGKLVWRAGTPKLEETPIQLCARQAGGNGCINGTKVTTCPPGFCVGDNCLGTSVTNESGHTSTDLQGTSGSGRGNEVCDWQTKCKNKGSPLSAARRMCCRKHTGSCDSPEPPEPSPYERCAGSVWKDKSSVEVSP